MNMSEYWDFVFTKLEAMSHEEVRRLLEKSGFDLSEQTVSIDYNPISKCGTTMFTDHYVLIESPHITDFIGREELKSEVSYNAHESSYYVVTDELQKAA